MDNLSFEKFKMIKNYLLLKKEKKSLHDYLIDKNNNYINGLFNQNNKKIIRTKLIDYNLKERTNFEKLYQNNLINHYCNRDIKKTMGYSQSYLHNLTDLLSKSNDNDNYIEERTELLSLKKYPIKLNKKRIKNGKELFNHKKLNLTGNDRYFYNKSKNKMFKSNKCINENNNNKYKFLSLFNYDEYLQNDDFLKQPTESDDNEEDSEKLQTKHIIHLKDYYKFYDPNKKSFANKFNLKSLDLINKNKISYQKKINPDAQEFIKGVAYKRSKNESSVYYDIKNNINNNIFPIIKNVSINK